MATHGYFKIWKALKSYPLDLVPFPDFSLVYVDVGGGFGGDDVGGFGAGGNCLILDRLSIVEDRFHK